MFDMSIRRSWTCRLVEANPPLFEFVCEFEKCVQHEALGTIDQGTISHEYYWLDRWYNIFRFHRPDGEFRNYYCNINLPPTYENGVLDYVDLDLDIVVWPDWTYKILDREEYESNAGRFGYSNDMKERVDNTLQELIILIGTRSLP